MTLQWWYLSDADVLNLLETYARHCYELCFRDNSWWLYDGSVSNEHTELLAKGENLKKLVFNAMHYPYKYQEWNRLCL